MDSHKHKKRQQKFHDFINWFQAHVKGDEKGEGQLFLERFIQAFGNEGIKEVGASCEERVKKKSGYMGFADLVWKPRMILELKKRGENLARHYSQAFEYWVSLVPNRPRYMVLCNFDEFWIYDLNIQIHDPVHKLKTFELASNPGPFNFLFPTPETPIFDNNNVEVTQKTAKIIGEIFTSISKREPNYQNVQRYVLQIVVALFAQDINLIPQYFFQRLLKEAIQNEDFTEEIARREIKNLFVAMSVQDFKKKVGRYKEIPYFNGGIFNDIAPIELNFNEIRLLYEASCEDWSKIRPSIFGAIFESTLNSDERHAKGVHFTSELDILKIVGPTIIKPFKNRITQDTPLKDLKKMLKELGDLKILDPACGSGNFLYVAYRELVRLEMEIQEMIFERFVKGVKKFNPGNLKITRIHPKSFYGIDINSFGVELAKVALSIGRKLAADEFHLQDSGLPFDNLDSNIICADALFTKWPDADVIIGNPPFLGGKRFRQEYNDEYIEKIYKRWPEVKGQVDFCIFWFRLAHESKAWHCGLVGTNSITQNVSRKASLDYIVNNSGHIHHAVSSQKWSGEAMVHVSIVNWTKENPKEYILDGKKVTHINSSLRSKFDITQAKKISENLKKSFKGCSLIGRGFIISKELAFQWIKQDKKNKKILRPIISGNQLVDPNKKFDWVIDFFDMSLEEASLYKLPFFHVKSTVKPIRKNKRVKVLRELWWQFERKRPDLRKAIQNLSGYFLISTIHKYTIFRFINTEILPTSGTIAIASDDFYILGILNSRFHSDWVKGQGSTLGETKSYINSSCFETFPFPTKVSEKQKNIIRSLMTELENFRNAECIKRKISLTKLYNEFINEAQSELYKRHQELDRAVCDAYGWKYNKHKDYNEDLFYLNQSLAL